jgi:hypothetical protein
LPIASDEKAGLDTRVLLWPVSARDGEHPHADGWAAFMAARGKLAASERRGEERLPERDIPLWRPEVLLPEDGVRHHIHNRGNEVGLTIHIFGA